MRHALVAVIMSLVLAFGTVFAATAGAHSPEPQGCIINVLGIKVCGTLLGEPLTNIVEVTVPGPTITAPPVTVQGPTITVRPDPIRLVETETVRPAPVRVTETVTAAPQAQTTATATATATATVTATETIRPDSSSNNSPAPTVTETIRPNGQPVPTATETVTVTQAETATGQPQPESGTVDPSESQDDDFLRFDLDLGDESVSAGEASVGLLGALLILLAIWAGMVYGFRIGRASSEAEESDFIREVLDENKTS